MAKLLMHNAFTFYFKGTDVINLAEHLKSTGGGYILVKCGLEVATTDQGKKVGIMCVNAHAFHGSKKDRILPPTKAVDSITGCPVPPCVPTNGIVGDECEKVVNNLFETYENADFKTNFTLK